MNIENIGVKIIGMYLDDAEKYFENNSINYRICYQDDIVFIGTCDYNPERLNLTVKNNIIESVLFG